MNFSNKFKLIWWASLLLVLTGMSVWRFYVGSFINFDLFLFVFWFILVLFPIISEISLFGINVKKDIEAAKNEIKSHIAEIKNHINYQPIINLNSAPAAPKEYEKKIKEEIQEESKQALKNKITGEISITPNNDERKTSVNEKTQERLNKLLSVEKSINEILRSKFGDNYKTQIKLENQATAHKIIVDGLVLKDGSIEEIIEIKFITAKSFDHFYFVALRFIGKVFRVGMRVRVRFIIVSESMDITSAMAIKEQIDKLNFNKSIIKNLPSVVVDFYRLENESLVEVKI